MRGAKRKHSRHQGNWKFDVEGWDQCLSLKDVVRASKVPEFPKGRVHRLPFHQKDELRRIDDIANHNLDGPLLRYGFEQSRTNCSPTQARKRCVGSKAAQS
ncbi:MAG: hypothetical protein DMF61_14810 [Blastocatellia bacterium AA13]|nr:MAG: hypothetical protein DMF61_14810 [Blastocatellia bacterium AA13]